MSAAVSSGFGGSAFGASVECSLRIVGSDPHNILEGMILGGYAVLSKQIVFGPLIYRLHPFPRGMREIWFAPTVLGLPWLYAFFSLIDSFLRTFVGPDE